MIFGLLGPNGAGKTTLVKLLLGVLRPTSGGARLLGRSIRTPSARREVGFLPEGHRFPRYLTAERALWLYGQLSGYRGPELRREIDEKLEQVGLAAWRKRKLKTFSKGMLQRLGLAQAMLGHPRIVFLDEPTDGVDPVGRVEIRDLLVALQARGCTVFLNSHLLSEVEQVCDRVAILTHGRVAREGTVEELTREQLGTTYSYFVTPLTEVQRKTLEEDARIRVEDRRLLVRVEREEELDDLTDRLRASGVGIRGLAEVRQTLENVFIDIVRNEKAVRP
jgi:ABC-2 type transport system ATP-binding protein